MENIIAPKIIRKEAKDFQTFQKLIAAMNVVRSFAVKTWNSQLDYERVNKQIQETRLKYESYRTYL